MEESLLLACQKFYGVCCNKLEKKGKEGRIGWDNPHWKEAFKKRIKDLPQFELTQENLVNIANYCNFLWNLKQEEIEMLNEGVVFLGNERN